MLCITRFKRANKTASIGDRIVDFRTRGDLSMTAGLNESENQTNRHSPQAQ